MGAACCWVCDAGGTCGSACAGGVKASVTARGQADSARESAWVADTGGGAKKLLSACELDGRGAGRVGAAGCSDFGSRKLFTRAISSWGWNGLRMSSSAPTETALSATFLLTTPDMRMTGVALNCGCCLIWLQTE